jgi:hypothetical protein
MPGRTLDGVRKLNLHNNVTDASWMNEVLSYRLFRDAEVPSSRTSYARVYLTVPGEHDGRFLGLYSIVENPDNAFARDHFGTKKGTIFKPVARSPFDDLGDSWDAYARVYDAKTPLSDEETRRVIAFAKLVSHASDADFEAQLADYLDLDAFARFMAVTVLLSNRDSILGMGQNYLVYLQPGTKRFQFMPWDLDHSFGQFMGGPSDAAQLNIRKPWNGSIRFLERVFKVNAFMRLYLRHLRAFSTSIYAPERILAQVDELAAVLRPAVSQESPEKLALFDQVVSGKSDEAAGARVGRGQRGSIKGFVPARVASILAQLDQPVDTNAAATSAGDDPGGPFGPPGGRGGPFDPGAMLASRFLEAADSSHDGQVSPGEFTQTFDRWFTAWDSDRDGVLAQNELLAGLARDFIPNPGRR